MFCHFQMADVSSYRRFLIYGKRGCGKTILVSKCIARSAPHKIYQIGASSAADYVGAQTYSDLNKKVIQSICHDHLMQSDTLPESVIIIESYIKPEMVPIIAKLMNQLARLRLTLFVTMQYYTDNHRIPLLDKADILFFSGMEDCLSQQQRIHHHYYADRSLDQLVSFARSLPQYSFYVVDPDSY